MRIDLDEHERVARAAAHSMPTRYFQRPERQEDVVWSPVVDGRDTCVPQSYADCFRSRDAAHIAANSPPVTLALIERIRELEAMLVRCGYTFNGTLPPPLAAEFVALLEKGVVVDEV